MTKQRKRMPSYHRTGPVVQRCSGVLPVFAPPKPGGMPR